MPRPDSLPANPSDSPSDSVPAQLPEAALPGLALQLSPADRDALTDLYLRGTPENTLRAYERDLLYITAWKAARLGAAPAWPEPEATALCFLLDHARDLSEAPPEDPARRAAQALIARGLRRGLACPAPATLDRRIASWRAFHRMRGLASPFDRPLLRQARAKARRAAARRPAPKSAHPITRPVLEGLIATCGDGLRGIRDRALLMLGWASGGRRRSELVALQLADLNPEDLNRENPAPDAAPIRIALPGSKTTRPETTPPLLVKGRAAAALRHWIAAAALQDGPLFRPISKSGRVLERPLSPAAGNQILRRRLILAGHEPGFASAHGLRSGFLTQAALDGAPLQAAMRLSLHRSAAQAQRYYDDVDLAENPATDLLDPLPSRDIRGKQRP